MKADSLEVSTMDTDPHRIDTYPQAFAQVYRNAFAGEAAPVVRKGHSSKASNHRYFGGESLGESALGLQTHNGNVTVSRYSDWNHAKVGFWTSQARLSLDMNESQLRMLASRLIEAADDLECFGQKATA